MTGKFEGLTDVQWDLLKPLMPPDPPKRGKGKPHTPWRKICNTIFWVKKKRWQVERAIAWLQRKYRRLVVRWERRTKYWKRFLNFGLALFWIDRLSGEVQR